MSDRSEAKPAAKPPGSDKRTEREPAPGATKPEKPPKHLPRPTRR